jgi:hypothetical protein
MQGEVCSILGSFQIPLISLPLTVPCGNNIMDFTKISIFLHPEPRHSGIQGI